MDAMKKAQEFTTVAKDLQEQLRSTVIEASVRSGQVTVTMTGQQVPLKVVVTDDLLAKGSEEVCILSHFEEVMLRYICVFVKYVTDNIGICTMCGIANVRCRRP